MCLIFIAASSKQVYAARLQKHASAFPSSQSSLSCRRKGFKPGGTDCSWDRASSYRGHVDCCLATLNERDKAVCQLTYCHNDFWEGCEELPVLAQHLLQSQWFNSSTDPAPPTTYYSTLLHAALVPTGVSKSKRMSSRSSGFPKAFTTWAFSGFEPSVEKIVTRLPSFDTVAVCPAPAKLLLQAGGRTEQVRASGLLARLRKQCQQKETRNAAPVARVPARPGP